MPDQQLRSATKALLCPAASCKRFDRPVFILAPPRSGSTLLFECLATTGVFHLRAEADLYWWQIWPYRRAVDTSDLIGEADASRHEVDRLFRVLYRQAVIARIQQRDGMIAVRHLLGTARIRYLDKTIANCFHLEVLARFFPDASFVFLVRDPRASIASMIEGWPYRERFGKPQLTPVLKRLEPRTIGHWSYPAPPGWQEVVGRPLVEICAWSWRQHVEAVLEFFERRPQPPIRVAYEQLVHDLPDTVRELASALDLPWPERAEAYARRAPPSRTTVSGPSRDKWRRRHAWAIEQVLPAIEVTARRIGYDLGIDVAATPH
jgi:LPS sulfotransferase NodH